MCPKGFTLGTVLSNIFMNDLDKKYKDIAGKVCVKKWNLEEQQQLIGEMGLVCLVGWDTLGHAFQNSQTSLHLQFWWQKQDENVHVEMKGLWKGYLRTGS